MKAVSAHDSTNNTNLDNPLYFSNNSLILSVTHASRLVNPCQIKKTKHNVTFQD